MAAQAAARLVQAASRLGLHDHGWDGGHEAQTGAGKGERNLKICQTKKKEYFEILYVFYVFLLFIYLDLCVLSLVLFKGQAGRGTVS